MPGSHCFSLRQVCATRVTRLDENGSPMTGAGNGLVSNALISAQIDPDVEAATTSTVKNACGDVCATARDCDKLLGVNVTLNLCQLDAQLLYFAIGGDLFLDLAGDGVGDVLGMQLPLSTDACANGVALELFAKAWDGGQQATPPFGGGTAVAYYHFVFPKVTFQIGQNTFEDAFATITLNGYSSENSNITANGPYDDWPTDIAAAGGVTSSMGFFLDTNLPESDCDAIEVTSIAS